PLAIWLAYSKRIASSGGLTAFVDAATGRTAARAQALVWIVSYFLYLPYTVTCVVYDVVAVVFPGLSPYRASLELVLPAAIVVLVVAPLSAVLVLVSAVALGRLVLVVLLPAVSLNQPGGGGSACQHPHPAPHPRPR